MWLRRPLQNNGAQFVEYSTQCSVPLGQVSHGTTSDSMWFTIPKGCKKNPGAVARVEIGTGQITEFTVGKSASPLVIAENAGYVWAADQNRLKTGSRPIYRFNEDGTYTTFVLPSAIVVNSMTAGPDGNLWFSGVYQNKKVVEGGYGFVTPSGASTLYSLPGNPTPQLVSITSGSDGNLWIADENGAIDKVAPSNGALTTYSVGGHPYAITSSSNVQVYSDSSAAQLSTIDRNGKFTVYPAPQGEHPAFLARKTDGSVLFVDSSNNSSAIGTFVPSAGTYAAEAQAPNAGLRYLFNGPDGNMWFSDAYGHIGAYLKFVLTTSPASISLNPSACSATFTASEPGFTGTLSATTQNAGVATVVPAGGGSGQVFTVTGAGNGSTAITVQDSMENVVSVPVTVDGCPGKTIVYVSDNSQVLIYDAQSNSEIGSISQGIGGPTGMDVDSAGNLYVANSNAGDGVAFAYGASSPFATYTNPGGNPWDITKCPDGTVYIAPLSSSSVAIYANGSLTPTGSITNGDDEQNYAVHCDPSSNVYVEYYSKKKSAARVTEYGPGGTGSGTLLGMSGGGRSSMTIDQNADVVFSNDTVNDIEFWAPGASSPYKTLTTFEGVGIIQYLKFGAGESLLWAQVSEGGGTYAYAIDPGSGAIQEQLPYVAAGGPGLAVYPADVFSGSRVKLHTGRTHWNPPSRKSPQPAPTASVR